MDYGPVVHCAGVSFSDLWMGRTEVNSDNHRVITEVKQIK